MSDESDAQAFGDVPLYRPLPSAPAAATLPAAAPGLVADPDPAPADTPPIGGSAERLVSAFFLLSAAAAVAFVVVYWIHAKPTDNWVNGLLGVTAAVALGGVGVGAILWAKLLMPHEEAVQDREPFGSPRTEAVSAAETWNAAAHGTGIVSRPLLRRSFLLAGGTLALPALVTLRSFNDKPKGELKHTDWTAGARMVDEFNNPVRLGDLEINSIATVFPENHTDPDSAASSAVLLIRLPLQDITAKTGPKSYEGHVAYSKICTHAGCPASLYDQQTHVLLCPCHQSQFQVLNGCQPAAGPATRPLPQLAIGVDSENYFIAKGDFAVPVGPGFWER